VVSVAKRFGANLVHCRKRVGLSQEEVAWRASLHRTQIGELERGGRQPRIDTLVKLSGALGVTPNDLLDGISWKPTESRPGGFETQEALPGRLPCSHV
jgi:transcriptional regulator with XRE-family HTH domain